MAGAKLARIYAIGIAVLSFAGSIYADDPIRCAPPPLPGNVGNVAGLTMCINNANALGGGTIDLGGLTYTLTATLPNISSTITIENGTITKNQTLQFRLLHVVAPGSLSLISVTLENGNDTSIGGGAVRCEVGSQLGLIKDSSFINNQSEAGGGAIHLLGVGNTIIRSTFTNNTGGFGGAILVFGGHLELISDSIFQGNESLNGSSGAAIGLVVGGTMGTVVSSIFAGNLATFSGGAIHMEEASFIELIDRSTFSFNQAQIFFGGAINSVFGDTDKIGTISNCTFNNNTAAEGGGAIGVQSGTVGTMYNNTFNQNTAAQGGAIFVGPPDASIGSAGATIVELFNNTVAGNSATTANGGGGIYDCHVIENMISNIVGRNIDTTTSPPTPDDIVLCEAADLVSASFNLIGVGTANNGFIAPDDANYNEVGTLAFPLDPNLGVLKNNGGPTFTMALLTNSVAIGAGANPLGLLHDQRGRGFQRTTHDQTDMGAYQVQRSRTCPCRPGSDCRPDDCREHHP